MPAPIPPSLNPGAVIRRNVWENTIRGMGLWLENTRSMVSAQLAADLTLVNNTWVPAPFVGGSEIVDRTDLHSTSTSTANFSLGDDPGFWFIAVTGQFDGGPAAGVRRLRVMANGAQLPGLFASVAQAGGSSVSASMCGIARIESGWVATLEAFQNSGSSLTLNNGSNFTAIRVGGL